ncbi:hypothetical protein ACF09L_26635 [Streptomyces sp. NPDC014779]|uniref:hypothetical protein n=1 Tax=Streptomyces sp. NPDC014779 TaxID=3364911 RepID=UPI0036F9D51C
MTGPGGTWVSSPAGPLHSGIGNQINYWTIVDRSHLARGGAARQEIVREHRLRLAHSFVRPRGYGRAADRLAEPGAVVILQGTAGSGRRATATMLLMEASAPEGRIEELPAEVKNEGDVPEAEPDDCYLLDLSGVPDRDYRAAQKTLMRYRSIVEKEGARLVVVAPDGLDWMLDAELASLVLSIERPRGRAVFSRHLRARGVPFAYEDLSAGELARWLAAAPMRELDRLAELTDRARGKAAEGSCFADWREEALSAATNWSHRVAVRLRECPGVQERALLLAGAMVHGAPAEAIPKAARLLLKVLGHPEDRTPKLAQAGLGEQLEGLELVRDGDGRVRFDMLDYDSAVRRHFWENFPELRPGFRDWVQECVTIPELGAEERAALVCGFAEQAFWCDRTDDLIQLVEQWTDPENEGRFRAEAAALLELGLSHDLHGSRFRARVYQWVTTSISPDLAQVLTDVCRHVVAATHPDQALVRLRYLALMGGDEYTAAAGAARAALVELARKNRRRYASLVHRLLNDRRRDAALDVLLALLEPTEPIGDPPWQEFALAWRAVMSGKPLPRWEGLVTEWLTRAAERRVSDRAPDALLIAAMGDRRLLDQLYVMTCEWAEETQWEPDEARRRIADRLCREIDLAQGIVGIPSDARITRDGT